jgi:hypothetical protein
MDSNEALRFRYFCEEQIGKYEKKKNEYEEKLKEERSRQLHYIKKNLNEIKKEYPELENIERFSYIKYENNEFIDDFLLSYYFYDKMQYRSYHRSKNATSDVLSSIISRSLRTNIDEKALIYALIALGFRLTIKEESIYFDFSISEIENLQQELGTAVLISYKEGDSWKAWCPYCQVWHSHSPAEGWRSVHCKGNPYSNNERGEYYIRHLTKKEISEIKKSIE